MDESTSRAQAVAYIERERIHYGFTKRTLYTKAAVSRSSYFRYLRGDTRGPLATLAINRLKHALEDLIAERDARRMLG